MIKRLVCTGEPTKVSVLVTAGDLDVSRLIKVCNVVQWSGTDCMPRSDLIREIANCQGMLCLLRDTIDADVLEAATNLRTISTLSVGYDHIIVDACKARGIIVTHTPDVLTEAVAETVVTLLLVTGRRIVEAVDEAKSGLWQSWCGTGICGSTVGILGMGRIGFSVAEKLKAFKPARILYHNRKPNPDRAQKIGAEYVELDDLYAQSDFLILTCAYAPEMEKMFNKNTFAKMKKEAILINSSRGTIIDQEDLHDALSTGEIRAAGLDVTNPEPLPIDHPLFTLKNCVIFPHIGSATNVVRSEMYDMAVDNLLAVLANSEPVHRVI